MDAGTQMNFPPIPAGLTERDFVPVKDLIEEVRNRERGESFAKAVITWQNAFTVLKKLEKRLGLPQSEREMVVYKAIVSELRSAGYWLIDGIHETSVDLVGFGVSFASLKACLAELEIDDGLDALNENSQVLARLEKHFA